MTTHDGPTHVDHVIDRILGALAREDPLPRIMTCWDDVATGAWSSARPVDLRSGVLTVAVPDGVTASVLRYRVAELLGRLEQAVPQAEIGRVAFRVARQARGGGGGGGSGR